MLIPYWLYPYMINLVAWSVTAQFPEINEFLIFLSSELIEIYFYKEMYMYMFIENILHILLKQH